MFWFQGNKLIIKKNKHPSLFTEGAAEGAGVYVSINPRDTLTANLKLLTAAALDLKNKTTIHKYPFKQSINIFF